MQAALRSDRTALALLAVMGTILLLPVFIFWLGLPPRIEAYKSVATTAGTVGGVVQAIYQSPQKADIVVLGSSLVTAAVDPSEVSRALSQRLHRNSSVQVLAMNWPGLDLQYYMLRDFLSQHNVHLLVWNLPEPHSRAYEYPHIQSFRWVRFGEYPDALKGLSFRYQAALYGEMVIGAPRQLLSKLRPNLLGDEAREIDPTLARTGYYGASFIPDHLETPAQHAEQLRDLGSAAFQVEGPAPGPYQMHFARLILELAKQHGCAVILLHVPLDAEYGDRQIPELADWQTEFGRSLPMLAAPSSLLFPGMDEARFHHFYRDSHLNENGQQLFTQAVTPSLMQAYEQAAALR